MIYSHATFSELRQLNIEMIDVHKMSTCIPTDKHDHIPFWLSHWSLIAGTTAAAMHDEWKYYYNVYTNMPLQTFLLRGFPLVLVGTTANAIVFTYHEWKCNVKLHKSFSLNDFLLLAFSGTAAISIDHGERVEHRIFNLHVACNLWLVAGWSMTSSSLALVIQRAP